MVFAKSGVIAIIFVTAVLLQGCASVTLYEDKKTGNCTELSLVDGTQAAIGHKF